MNLFSHPVETEPTSPKDADSAPVENPVFSDREANRQPKNGGGQ